MSSLGRENPKLMLTFGYYFRIGCPEQFDKKSDDSKVQRFQITFFGNEKHSKP